MLALYLIPLIDWPAVWHVASRVLCALAGHTRRPSLSSAGSFEKVLPKRAEVLPALADTPTPCVGPTKRPTREALS